MGSALQNGNLGLANAAVPLARASAVGDGAIFWAKAGLG